METRSCTCIVCYECAAEPPPPAASPTRRSATPVSAIAHHIRTPLAVLAANNSFLRDVNQPEPGCEIASVLDDNQLAIEAICQILESLARTQSS